MTDSLVSLAKEMLSQSDQLGSKKAKEEHERELAALCRAIISATINNDKPRLLGSLTRAYDTHRQHLLQGNGARQLKRYDADQQARIMSNSYVDGMVAGMLAAARREAKATAKPVMLPMAVEKSIPRQRPAKKLNRGDSHAIREYFHAAGAEGATVPEVARSLNMPSASVSSLVNKMLKGSRTQPPCLKETGKERGSPRSWIRVWDQSASLIEIIMAE